jgi:trans-aconitate methyltransferase
MLLLESVRRIEQPMAQNTIWNANLYDSKHAFVFTLGQELLELLAAKPAERILDIGCGTGHLTAKIAEMGAMVIGIDSSPAMIAKAQSSYPVLTFEVADARSFAFAEPFDAVFSNAALHWIQEAEAVVEKIAKALKPGGRLVVEFGGKGNVAAIASVLEQVLEQTSNHWQSAWYFPSIGEYAMLLEKYGLRVTHAWHFERPTKLEDGEAGLRNWLAMFASSALGSLEPQECETALSQIETQLRSTLHRQGDWYADYKRIRIVAIRE